MSELFNILKTESKTGKLPDFVPEKSNPYVFTSQLENAVRVAIYLGKPLLLTGEAGTGKTRLAFAIAERLGIEEPLVFNTKTTSTAKDLLYSYNHLLHFQHINSIKDADKKTLEVKDIEDLFIQYHALGKAILSKKREIVLIDEIDKAPRDLPNDILDVIENMEFEVPELRLGEKENETHEINIKKTGDKKNRPLIILTSNSEKSLPDAFLRRCVFYNIEINDELTLKILQEKYTVETFSIDEWTTIIKHFGKIRNLLQRKKPATAELISWVGLLIETKFPIIKLKLIEDKTIILSETETDHLKLSYCVLAKNTEDVKKIYSEINHSLYKKPDDKENSDAVN